LVFAKEAKLMRIKYCTQCVLPETKPDLSFDEKGICSACNAFAKRTDIDWDKRKLDFLELVKRHTLQSSSTWDCIVPVSGGKDSTAQVLKMLELNLNPLCVTSTTCDLSEIGRHNIENIKNLGVDYIEFSPNKKVRQKLNRFGLETVGDISWPEHVGIFTIPVRAAVQYRVPLLIWGENSQNEYGGPATSQESPVLNRRWLEEFGGLLGLRVSDVQSTLGLSESQLIPYTYPSDDELSAVGVTGLFLGHYFPWDGVSNYLVASGNGFTTYGKTVEGSIVDYENVDNYQTGIHDYFKYLKFGFGRATDIASLHIRRGRMTREQALVLIKKHDGSYPKTYLGKSLEEILYQIDMTIEEFNEICDRFMNTNLFEKNQNGTVKRNDFGTPIKVNYDN
jgi:N-acetyl sugar amidotransferase